MIRGPTVLDWQQTGREAKMNEMSRLHCLQPVSLDIFMRRGSCENIKRLHARRTAVPIILHVQARITGSMIRGVDSVIVHSPQTSWIIWEWCNTPECVHHALLAEWNGAVNNRSLWGNEHQIAPTLCTRQRKQASSAVTVEAHRYRARARLAWTERSMALRCVSSTTSAACSVLRRTCSRPRTPSSSPPSQVERTLKLATRDAALQNGLQLRINSVITMHCWTLDVVWAGGLNQVHLEWPSNSCPKSSQTRLRRQGRGGD